jgi:hypothetical protein
MNKTQFWEERCPLLVEIIGEEFQQFKNKALEIFPTLSEHEIRNTGGSDIDPLRDRYWQKALDTYNKIMIDPFSKIPQKSWGVSQIRTLSRNVNLELKLPFPSSGEFLFPELEIYSPVFLMPFSSDRVAKGAKELERTVAIARQKGFDLVQQNCHNQPRYASILLVTNTAELKEVVGRLIDVYNVLGGKK